MATKSLMLVLVGGLVNSQVALAVRETGSKADETKICRKAEARTGTRIKTGRKCKTAEEWRKEDEERARIPVSLTVTEGQPDGTPRQRPQ